MSTTAFMRVKGELDSLPKYEMLNGDFGWITGLPKSRDKILQSSSRKVNGVLSSAV